MAGDTPWIARRVTFRISSRAEASSAVSDDGLARAAAHTGAGGVTFAAGGACRTRSCFPAINGAGAQAQSQRDAAPDAVQGALMWVVGERLGWLRASDVLP